MAAMQCHINTGVFTMILKVTHSLEVRIRINHFII